jgi:23S rRNA pseudouridine1911/1915/1917 synthase
MKVEKKGDWFDISITSDQAGKTIEAFLKEEWKVPKKLLHHFRMHKRVKLNHELVSWQKPLENHDRLQVQFYFPEEQTFSPSYGELDLLYEDEHLMIINKPAGMDTHPNEPAGEHTLSNIAAFHFQAQGLQTVPRHIHRLDRGTSGAILFAKHPLAAALLDQMLEKREIKRTYIAIAHGIIKQNKGIIDEPIGRDRHHATRKRVSPSGQHAVTHYRVLKRNEKLKQTLVELSLQTGRTHQIRVHMAHLGYPLIGDILYGGPPFEKQQALHAVRIRLKHPFTDEMIDVSAPPASVFQRYEPIIRTQYNM